YFVSYFDYYQPEAYLPATDTYIEKDSSINEEIERLRLSTVSSLMTRRDVVVVASVSCIYGLASPEDFGGMVLRVEVGGWQGREGLLRRLVGMLYEREEMEFGRGKFRVRGEVVEVYPSQEEGRVVRFEFFGEELERIVWVEERSGRVIEEVGEVVLFPAKQFVTPREKLERALKGIEEELEERVRWFEERGKLVEAQRIRLRTEHDLELLRELGYCPGVENYSRHLSGRAPGTRPYTLMDFLPADTLVVIDESHVTVPQIGGMYAGDRSRKETLVEYGFRLPSALDNRPLNFEEFMESARQILYVSATPGAFELANCFVGNEGWVKVEEIDVGERGEWLVLCEEEEFD
ncbi:MAG: excinuclease ABC subunit B, partial [Chthoniobacterales bacterium]|nr:excinuclease ABC subunit B [Chthoniobacterales bacterium]